MSTPDAPSGYPGARGPAWGLPPLPADAVLLTHIRESLDAWVEGQEILSIQAPSGFGKTTLLGAWVRTRPASESIIWLGGSRFLSGWDQVWRVFADAMLDLGLIDKATREGVDGIPQLFVALHRLQGRLILVIDDADRLMPKADLDALEREVTRFPNARAIVVTSTPLRSDPAVANLRRAVLARNDFAWSERDAREVLKDRAVASMVRMPLHQLVAATSGRASAIIDYFTAVPESIAERSPDALRARWLMQRAQLARDPEKATRLVLLLSQFLEVPRDYVSELGGPDALDTLVDLQREGLVEAIIAPGASEPTSFRVYPDDRKALSELARGPLPDDLVQVHSAAASFFRERDRAVASMFHLGRAARHSEVLELFRLSLPIHDSVVGLEDLREALRALPHPVLAQVPESLALRVIVAHVPPVEERSERSEFESTLLSLPRRTVVGLSLQSKVLFTAAAVVALIGNDRSGEAAAAGRALATELLRAPWNEVSRLGRVTGLLWAAQAEAELSEGRISSATEFARAALDSTGGGNLFGRFLAESMMSAVSAIEGDFEWAAELATRAELHYSLGSWPESSRLAPVVLARMLIASARMDAPAMADAAARFRTISEPGDPWWAGGLIADAYALLFSGQQAKAVATARRALRISGSHTIPTILRSFIAAANADMLNAVVRPGAAIAALEEGVETAEHAFCYGVRRAQAALALGDPRRALAVTEPCIALGGRHATRSLVQVLLRRAVAQELLELTTAADVTFSDALSHISDSGSVIGLLGLDRATVVTLWNRLENRDPVLYAATLGVVTTWLHEESTVSWHTMTTALSARELEVLVLLRSGATNAQLGAALFLSPNTVKSHLRNLYRKLGARTRYEAIERAESLGLGMA